MTQNYEVTQNYDNFLSKIFWNIIKNMKNTMGFTSFLDGFVERQNFKLGEKVIQELEKDHQKYVDSFPEGKKPSIVSYGKIWLSKPEKYKNIILEEVPEVNNDWQIDNNTLVLKDLLDISTNEAKILQFALLYEEFPYSITHPLSQICKDEEFKDIKKLYSMLFDIELTEVAEIFKGFLFKSGFIKQTDYSKPYYILNEELNRYFYGYTLDKETIEDKLFPTILESNLTIKMYPHISDQINIVKNILNYSLVNKNKGTNILFWGLPGTGKTELALALAKESNVTIRSIGDISPENQEELSRTQRLVSLKLAMKIYEKRNDVILLFDEMEDLTQKSNNTDEQYSKSFINRIIENTPVPIIWTTNDIIELGQAILRRMDYSIEFTVPNSEARKIIWKKYIKDYDLKFNKKDIDFLSHNFDIIPAAIKNAAKISKASNLNLSDTIDVIKDFDKLIHFGYERKFNILRNSDTPYDLSVINANIDIVELVKKIKKAKPKWSMCLYGPPGTGKSEFGRYLAEEIDKLVLFKRASDLESMYVGGTEKNIANAFKQASEEEKILLIDEGDTFFSARSGNNKSWENSKVNEMLSQMEMHDQPFIITTNMFDNLDPAALRRFTFKLKFDFLKPEMAKKLFKEYFGKKAPDDILKQMFLAPGDFSNVKKKVDILEITDVNEIYKMLMEELEVKPNVKQKIGF